ncbi:23S ribosomal RNA methyltransferase Erm [Corynebacterium timonense]|uniref:23S rRNA (Adenine-N6)-dimethyltransferase n=1 Tax=Corynebacterium timonense TaxID=441500 RepID=A0A1H1LFM3_9CORY|nr:23S ribosomal RNA methyltransferase Erm [Corynebacterium timonense]SDR73316.1 23S rRNA (adenine-N6)-dimethyltransferase [Corynebacterium timonense]
MPTYRGGRHEHGQNFLTDPSAIATITRLVTVTDGPIIEIGPGDGALTTPLVKLGRPVTAVEIDTRLARRLAQRLPSHVEVVADDFLTYRLPSSPHVIVGNLPFHQTTAILRRILHAPAWTDAIVLVQWEVARRRAGVGGTTMMTAQWSPWFEFALHSRVPARAFTPRPGVDGGILTIHRREQPLLSPAQQRRFRALVHRVYTGPGRGLAQILARTTSLGSPPTAQAWLTRHGVSAAGLPKDMPVEAWVDLFKTTGSSPPPRRAQTQRTTSRRRSR